jgi:hypothetical protein
MPAPPKRYIISKLRPSELIAVLPPISDSEHTAKRYRAALLNMAEHAEEFDRWCEEMKPVVESPPRLWDAFEAYRRGDKPQDGDDNDDEEGDDNESRASQHEQDLIDLRVEFDAKLKDVYAELRSLEGIVKSLSTLPKSQLLEIRSEIDRLLETAVDDTAQMDLLS